MSKITELMTQAFMRDCGWDDAEVELLSERRDREYTRVLYAMQAAIEALNAAGHRIVQKPLELTPAMAALCPQEAVHIFKTRRVPGMRDG